MLITLGVMYNYVCKKTAPYMKVPREGGDSGKFSPPPPPPPKYYFCLGVK